MFRRLAVVGVVALAAASAASARELQGAEKHGEAALAASFDDGEASGKHHGGGNKAPGAIKSVLKADGQLMDEKKAQEEKLKQKKWTQKVVKPLKKLPDPKKPAAKSLWPDKKGAGEAGESGEAVLSKKDAKQIEKDSKPGPKTKAAKKKYNCKKAKLAALADKKWAKFGESGEASGEGVVNGDYNSLCKPKKEKSKPMKVKNYEVIKYKIDKEDKGAKKAAKKGGYGESGEAFDEAGYAVSKKKLEDKVHLVTGKTPAVPPKPSSKKVDGKGSNAWNAAHPAKSADAGKPQKQKKEKKQLDGGEAFASEAEIKVKTKPAKQEKIGGKKHADEAGAGEAIKVKGKH